MEFSQDVGKGSMSMVLMCPQLANLQVVGNVERSWLSHRTNVIIYKCDAGDLRLIPGGAATGHSRLLQWQQVGDYTH